MFYVRDSRDRRRPRRRRRGARARAGRAEHPSNMQRVKDNLGLVAAAGALGVAVGAALPLVARWWSDKKKVSVNERLVGADMSQWFCEVNEQFPGTAHCLRVDRVLHSAKSEYQDVMVFKSTDFGNCLVLDGCIQYTERDEAAYQEMIAHIPLLAHANPRRVLVVGGGDGGVIAQVLKHASVEACTICEIDQMVMDVSARYFERVAPVWQDKRLTVNCGDAAEFMRRADVKGAFDVIIADTSDPDGPASSLFGPDFYRNMSEALAPGGVICTQAESVWLHMPLIKEIIGNANALYASVEYAITYIPTYPCGNIGLMVCRKAFAAGDDTPLTCARAVRAVPAELAPHLSFYNTRLHEAAFAAPTFVNRELAALLPSAAAAAATL